MKVEIITRIIVEKDVNSLPIFLTEVQPSIINMKWDTPIEIHSCEILSVQLLEESTT